LRGNERGRGVGGRRREEKGGRKVLHPHGPRATFRSVCDHGHRLNQQKRERRSEREKKKKKKKGEREGGSIRSVARAKSFRDCSMSPSPLRMHPQKKGRGKKGGKTRMPFFSCSSRRTAHDDLSARGRREKGKEEGEKREERKEIVEFAFLDT